MAEESRIVDDAVQVVSALLDSKVRRARICGCGSCKSEEKSFVDWLSGPPSPTPPLRETWWK
ncbi:MAG TPA: hypothetical protein VFZ12_03120 [Dehalococcoidia bacterium]|nr:hypothetical protein [Dehalococcoidia bacterium]